MARPHNIQADLYAAVHEFMCELLDEYVPAGELRRIVKSVRMTLSEQSRQDYDTGVGLLATMLTHELLTGDTIGGLPPQQEKVDE